MCKSGQNGLEGSDGRRSEIRRSADAIQPGFEILMDYSFHGIMSKLTLLILLDYKG